MASYMPFHIDIAVFCKNVVTKEIFRTILDKLFAIWYNIVEHEIDYRVGIHISTVTVAAVR